MAVSESNGRRIHIPIMGLAMNDHLAILLTRLQTMLMRRDSEEFSVSFLRRYLLWLWGDYFVVNVVEKF